MSVVEGFREFKMLFTPTRIGDMELKNRVVMAPMETGFATKEGFVSDAHISFYQHRAKGGVGCIIIGNACVAPGGQGQPSMLCVYDEAHIAGLKELIDVIHVEEAKVAVQLNHAGRQTLSSIAKSRIVAPSAIPCPIMREIPHALTKAEIHDLVESFAHAGKRVRDTGADAIEFHMGHGYLICQFLSAQSNKRDDEYGGSVENRTRFAREVVIRTRAMVGSDFPVICRISAEEMVCHGIELEDSVKIARILQDCGSSAIHVSACNYESFPFNIPCYYLEENTFLRFSERIKRSVEIPVIAVARLHEPVNAEKALYHGHADLISWGRPLIADPELPNKIKRGKWKSRRPCILCNRCIESISRGGLRCSVNPYVGREKEQARGRATTRKRVLVVGAGPGGMEAALQAADKGHDVILFEERESLGGALRLASLSPMKEGFMRLVEYYENKIKNSGVTVKLNTRFTLEAFTGRKPDIIIVATGAKASASFIEIECWDKVVAYNEALEYPRISGKGIIVVGGGPEGGEIADYFASLGNRVTVFETKVKIGHGLPTSVRFHLEERLKSQGVAIRTRCKVESIGSDGVVIQNKNGRETVRKGELVVLAAGKVSNDEIVSSLGRMGVPFRVIGDARKPGRIMGAIEEGAMVGGET